MCYNGIGIMGTIVGAMLSTSDILLLQHMERIPKCRSRSFSSLQVQLGYRAVSLDDPCYPQGHCYRDYSQGTQRYTFFGGTMVFARSYLGLLASALVFASNVLSFDNSRSDNLAVYYGQNSYGATHGSDTANWQQNLAHYCQDDTINAIPLAFLNVFFSTGGLPQINLANICSTDTGVFSGTSLPNCQFMAADIQACQAKGKIVTISLGGASASSSFTSDAQAQTFADTIWNVFLGGSSSTRPFGSAVLDGVDLDIEGGGNTGYAAFVNRIRSHASGASKPYYVTAAPQCPFPDASLGAVLNAASFDAVYVQVRGGIVIDLSVTKAFYSVSHLSLLFTQNSGPYLRFLFVYNNFCGLTNFNNPNAWNFGTWDNWAKNTSINKKVKVYIGAPASSTSAGSGYVDATTLGSIAKQTLSQYSSFGGIMLWDASQAYANNRFDVAVKSALGGSTGGGGGGTTPPPPPPTGCSGVAAWSSTVAYVGGSRVSYNGHVWTAKWWTEADIPGGPAGVWTDGGACLAKVATPSDNAPTVKGAASHSASAAPVPEASKKSSRFFKL